MRHTDTVRPIRLWAVSWACIANLINRPDALEKSSIGTQKFNAAVSSISVRATDAVQLNESPKQNHLI